MAKQSGKSANQNFSNTTKSGSPVAASSPLIPNNNTKAYSDLANTNAEKNQAFGPYPKKKQQVDEPGRLTAFEKPGPQASSPYAINVGFTQDSPVVVFSSEFVPLFDVSNEQSEQGKAISLKLNSSILTAKVATTLLTQNESAKSAVQDNKDNIATFLAGETKLLTQLNQVMNETYAALKIPDYFYDFLFSKGYPIGKISTYASSKVWQQSLIELKKMFLTHSSQFATKEWVRKNVKNDEDSYKLADVLSPPSPFKHSWLNPYMNAALPVPSAFVSDFSLVGNVNDIISFYKRILIDLWNPAITKEDPKNEFGVIFSDEFTIARLSNCITKEVLYSYALQESGALRANKFLEERGYSVVDSPNFKVWDHIIGNFTESAIEIPTSPIGNGRSMVSFSKRNAVVAAPNNTTGNNFDVLTVEDDYVQGSNVTPGSVYYVDGTLLVGQNGNFDVARVNSLKTYANDLNSSTHRLLSSLAVNIVDVDGVETYEKDQSVARYDVEYIMGKMTPIVNLYTKILIGQSQLTAQEEELRLTCLILKSIIDPDESYKSMSNSLLGNIFAAFMSAIQGAKSDQAISEVSNLISSVSSSPADDVDSFSSILVYSTTEVSESALQKKQEELDQLKQKLAEAQYLANNPTPDVAGAQTSLKYYQEEVAKTEQELQSLVAQQDSSKVTDKIKNAFVMINGMPLIIKTMLQDISNNDIMKGDFTRYSYQSRVGFLFTYFILILKTMSCLIPENVTGIYAQTFSLFGSTTNTKNVLFSIKRLKDAELESYYQPDPALPVLDADGNPIIVDGQPLSSWRLSQTNPIVNSISMIDAELKTTIDSVAIFRRYSAYLIKKIDEFAKFITGDFQGYLSSVKDAYTTDVTLSEVMKNDLLNLSLSDQQVKVTNYLMSELNDRISQENTLKSNLVALPAFKNFPNEFEKFMDVHGLNLVSYHMLAPYFRSQQFTGVKAVNKRIFGIGIPNGLMRSLRAYYVGGHNDRLHNIYMIKAYKNDILRPNVVFRPMTYLFESNRFPTRSLGNWDFDAFISDTFNLLTIPSKYVGISGEVSVHRNYSEAFNEDYQALSKDPNVVESIQRQIYSNHAVSFLIEEYMRWFTDCRFEESAYYNHTTPQAETSSTLQQTTFSAALTTGTPIGNSNSTATYTDPVSGQTYSIPVKKNVQQSTTTTPSTSKQYQIPVNDTIRSFFKHETFMMNSEVLKRRLVYPKKFDRVFNLIIDPDDFMIDEENTLPITIDNLEAEGVLIKQGDEYRYRDTEADDTTFCEYYFTIEPYEYKL